MLVVGERFPRLCSVEFHPLGSFLGRADKGTATAGGDHLVSVEGHDTIGAKGSDGLPVVFRTQCLSCIFQYGYLITVSYLHNLGDFTWISVQIDGNDGLGFPAGFLYPVLDGLLQEGRIHVPGVGLTVHKDRTGTQIFYWVC